MRLKTDFVTNSSSTSYIIFIPKKFNLRDHLSISENAGIIDSLINNDDLKYYKNHPDDYIIPSIEDLERVFDRVHKNDLFELNEYDNNRIVFNMIVNLCRELDLILTTFEGGPDDGSIYLISENSFQKRIDNLYAKIYNKKI